MKTLVERLVHGLAVLALAAAGLVVGASAASAEPLAMGATVATQFVAEESDEPSDEEADEPSDEDSDASDDSDDSDNSDADESDDSSDEPTDEPTDEPSSSYTDPTSDGSVEMPTDDPSADAAASDEAAANQTLGWALAGGGLLAAIAAFVAYRRMG